MFKKIIFASLIAVGFSVLMTFGLIFFAKSKIVKHTDKDLSFSGITLLEDYKVALSFKEDQGFINSEYFYAVPSGEIYNKFFGTNILIRVD